MFQPRLSTKEREARVGRAPRCRAVGDPCCRSSRLQTARAAVCSIECSTECLLHRMSCRVLLSGASSKVRRVARLPQGVSFATRRTRQDDLRGRVRCREASCMSAHMPLYMLGHVPAQMWKRMPEHGCHAGRPRCDQTAHSPTSLSVRRARSRVSPCWPSTGLVRVCVHARVRACVRACVPGVDDPPAPRSSCCTLFTRDHGEFAVFANCVRNN